MHETLECSSDSADRIITVGTVGSQLWELRGAVGDDHSGPVIFHSLKSRRGLVGLKGNELCAVSSLTFPKARDGIGGRIRGREPFQLV